ncbi:MAG TPA: hypothetical protein VJM31_19900 [Vicinamibacterales bacterium]|nr:hypothetical protein [Vicinamibacterales bacterium]
MGAGRTYHVYGLQLDSAWPLPYPDQGAPGLARVSLRRGSAKRFVNALGDTHVPVSGAWASAALADGWRYLRWSSIFEFLIQPDGRSVLCRPMYDGAVEAFHTHLGPSLSFALINLGIEPLHSTTVMVEGGAVALMGDCGYGKSSLGATFVRAGHALLTDDLLVLKRESEGFIAYPGAPRLKLFPEIAKVIFGPRVRGLRLERLTPKIIIPLTGTRAQQTPVPLKAIYMLTPPRSRHTRRGVTIRRLSPRRAFLELVRSTFNMAVTEPDRLERQFRLASDLALAVPVKTLSYPRKLSMLAAARKAILADLQG